MKLINVPKSVLDLQTVKMVLYKNVLEDWFNVNDGKTTQTHKYILIIDNNQGDPVRSNIVMYVQNTYTDRINLIKDICSSNNCALLNLKNNYKMIALLAEYKLKWFSDINIPITDFGRDNPDMTPRDILLDQLL